MTPGLGKAETESLGLPGIPASLVKQCPRISERLYQKTVKQGEIADVV